MKLIGTRQAAKLLGQSPGKLQQDIWHGRIGPPPQKGPSGSYLWTHEDLERYSWQILHRAYTTRGPVDQGARHE